jgi:hypothetical protein
LVANAEAIASGSVSPVAGLAMKRERRLAPISSRGVSLRMMNTLLVLSAGYISFSFNKVNAVHQNIWTQAVFRR